MIQDIDLLREDLRALLASPATTLPDYDADPAIRGRTGQFLVKAAVRAQDPKWVERNGNRKP